MRVQQIDLFAFGHYADTTLDLSRPESGLTVVHGPNEAGKSTARRALLAAIFGFDPHGPDEHRFGRHGLRIGARLIASDGSELSFVREGQTRVTRPDGTDLDPGVVAELCHGIGGELYARLFSVDHDELRSGSESLLAAGGEIGRLVFGAGLGSGSVTPLLQRLDQRAAELFSERGHAQHVTKALKAYREQMRSAKDARLRSRDWDHLLEAVAEAESQRADVLGRYERARRDQARLTRIRAARPLLARRAQALERLDELGALPSESWAERAASAADAYRTRRASRASSSAARARLAARVGAVFVPEDLLTKADLIDDLVEGIGRHEKDTGDLPKRRAELEGVRDRIAEQRRALGHAADDGRLVGEIRLGEIEALARRHAELTAAQRSADEELRNVRAQIAAATTHLAAVEVPPDVSALERIVRLARPRVDAARDVAAGRARQRTVAADLDAEAGRLGLGDREWAEIEALRVPTDAEIEDERRRRESSRGELARTKDERGKLAGEIRGMEKEIATSAPGVPDPERLAAARAHRSAGWRVVRQVLQGDHAGTSMGEEASWGGEASWGVGASLADAYEAAVTDADLAADERYDHADVIAVLTQRRARLDEARAQMASLDSHEKALVEEESVASSAWTQRWVSVGVEGGDPETMAAWRRALEKLAEQMRAWREREATLDAVADGVHQQATAIAHALGDAGEDPCSEALDQLVSQADAVVEGARLLEGARRTQSARKGAAEESEPSRLRALAQAGENLASWEAKWELTLRALSLEPGTSPDVAVAAVDAYRRLATLRGEAATLERRVAGIDEDREAYAARVDGVARALSSGVEAAGTLDVVAELQRRLTDARDAYQRREALTGELERATATTDEDGGLLEDARTELTALRGEGGLEPTDPEPDAGVDAVVERAREAASLRERVREIESDLLGQGGGRSIEELEAESAVEPDASADSLDATIDVAASDVDALTERLQEVSTQLIDAQRSLSSVTGSATAVDLEQDAQGSLALASELATEYARTALAAAVLRRTIERYGEQHRGPLIDRAGDLFSELTGGAFAELRGEPEGDHQVLLARRRGGELCSARELSDGTRDQLYLALRLAGVEHQLALAADPLPVVFDDILVHFDDRRASAAIRVMGELARRTQVLLFTHHESVVEIAQRELPPDGVAIVRLASRNHDLAPTSAVRDGARSGVTRGPGGRDARDASEEQLLAAAQGGRGAALTKAELLERSGVAEDQWARAVRSLVERGALVSEGQKRGTRYRPAG